jgi:hypothetical protein
LDELGDFPGVDALEHAQSPEEPSGSVLDGLADTAWLHGEEFDDEHSADASLHADDARDHAPTLPARALEDDQPAELGFSGGSPGHEVEEGPEETGQLAASLAAHAPDGRVEPGLVPDFEPGFVRQARRRERWSRPWVRALLGVLLLLLVLAGAGQAAWIWRDSLAARWPASRPALAALCAAAGCRLAPPRDATDLAIDASSMSPSGPSRLHLTVSLHNRGAHAVAYPWLQLSLGSGGDEDRLLVRKVISPEQYLGAQGLDPGQVRSRLHAGLAAAAELHIRLDLALRGGPAASYTVYLFYP